MCKIYVRSLQVGINEAISKELLWYLVGLITADGFLSKDGRHIDITAKDYKFLKKIKIAGVLELADNTDLKSVVP